MIRQQSRRNRKKYCRCARMLFRCLSAIFLLLVGAFFFDAVGRHLVRYVVERVYTPPAITPDNATVYNRFVALIKAHPEHERIFLNSWGTLRLDQVTYSLPRFRTTGEFKQVKGFSTYEVAELATISTGLGELECAFAEKRGTYVVFVCKRKYMMPTRPGVLYTLDGRNPNAFDDEFLNENKPFTPIKNNWYMSRQLVTSPFRQTDAKWSLPKSVIDRSLQYPE